MHKNARKFYPDARPPERTVIYSSTFLKYYALFAPNIWARHYSNMLQRYICSHRPYYTHSLSYSSVWKYEVSNSCGLPTTWRWHLTVQINISSVQLSCIHCNTLYTLTLSTQYAFPLVFGLFTWPVFKRITFHQNYWLSNVLGDLNSRDCLNTEQDTELRNPKSEY
jgi:hypothetical protein